MAFLEAREVQSETFEIALDLLRLRKRLVELHGAMPLTHEVVEDVSAHMECVSCPTLEFELAGDLEGAMHELSEVVQLLLRSAERSEKSIRQAHHAWLSKWEKQQGFTPKD